MRICFYFSKRKKNAYQTESYLKIKSYIKKCIFMTGDDIYDVKNVETQKAVLVS